MIFAGPRLLAPSLGLARTRGIRRKSSWSAERKMESRETESRVDENNGECVTLEWYL